MMEETIDSCKTAWMKASSDNERFAALFVIIKLLKSLEITDAQRREIFDIIEFNFLRRLLQSDTPERCPPNILKAVSVSILSCFCADPELAVNCELGDFIKPLKCILEKNLSAAEDEPLVIDILSSLNDMAVHETHRKRMIDNGMLTVLVKHYCTGYFGSSQTLQVLLTLIMRTDIQLTDENSDALNDMLKKMSNEFKTERTSKKFEMCEHILVILIKYNELQVSDTCALFIREAVTDILQNKLGKEQRDNAIKLSSLLIDKFWSQWLLDDDEGSKKFFIVLVQIICVEVRMLLEDKTVDDLAGDAFLLTACYRILESVISTMINESWFESNREYATQLLNSLKMAIETILDFVQNLSENLKTLNFLSCMKSEQFSNEQIVLASIRVLCSWLAEETAALQDKVHKILPFFIHVCSEWFKQTHLLEINCDLDPIYFFIPPLCHFTADDESRKVLLNNGIMDVLLKFMEHNWSRFDKVNRFDVEIHLISMCGVLLNLVMYESQAVIEKEEFFTILKLLMNALPLLSAGTNHLILRAHFSVLGLFITKQCHKKVESCESGFYRFLSASIKFLWDAHHVERENDIAVFVVARPYREVWNDIMEQWFLGMEVLSSLLPLMPWIAGFLAETGWPTVIIDALEAVSPNEIDENIKLSYQALLCPLTEINSDIVETIKQRDGIVFCRKHRLHDLEALLS